MAAPRRCDVVIPVFDAARDFERLVASLVACRHETFTTVFVVDDASAEAIEPLIPGDDASRRFVYSRNARNLGFAASVNRVLRRSTEDVVLLNSDTLVFDDWIDRLLDALASDETIASATPMSNAATIMSYPQRLADNAALADVGWAELDSFCKHEAPAPVDVPTGVGFCMAIRRACLDQIGLLDEDAFAAGYGEENDFCRRAAAKGWRNVAAPGVFVFHRGGGSFKERRRTLCAEAQKVLHRRYPDYPAAVARFVAADPLRPVRARLDAARIAKRGPHPLRLVLGAGAPAGIALELRVSGRVRRTWQVAWPGEPAFLNLPSLHARSNPCDAEAVLEACRVVEIVVPACCMLPRSLIRAVLEAAGNLKLRISRESGS